MSDRAPMIGKERSNSNAPAPLTKSGSSSSLTESPGFLGKQRSPSNAPSPDRPPSVTLKPIPALQFDAPLNYVSKQRIESLGNEPGMLQKLFRAQVRSQKWRTLGSSALPTSLLSPL